MEIFFIKLLQLLLALSILILLHEGGHFFFSKLFGVRVEKFYLFFDLGLGKKKLKDGTTVSRWDGRLLHTNPKEGDTEYGLGWLPLGGYCKIAGMIDESFDTEQMKKPAQPWEFRTKPAWQRLLIMIGGVLVNFLLALFIYSMIMFTWGESYIRPADMTQGMKFNKEAKALGFQDNDILLGTDLREFKKYDGDLFRDLSKAQYCDVIRNGKKVRIALPGDLNLLSMLKSSPRFATPFVPNVVDSVLPNTPAEKMGLQKGDRILAFHGQAITSQNEFLDNVMAISDDLNEGMSHDDSVQIRTAPIVVLHAATGKIDTTNVTLTSDLKLGFSAPNIQNEYKETHVSYGFLESFPAGISYGLDVLGGYISDLKYVFTADGAKSLGGFGAIGSLFPSVWDWHLFWLMTAFLSIILAFMNILPIPALDGGHVLFLIYEMITGKTPSEKFLLRAEYIGFGVLILLMVVANLNDVLRWIGLM